MIQSADVNEIGFRLNRLEFMHNIEYDPNHIVDPNYEFPSHDDYFMPIEEQTSEQLIPQTTSSNQSQNVSSPSQTVNLQRIGLVESSVNDIKNELRNLISVITPILQTSANSN
jgi:hypothetical protein